MTATCILCGQSITVRDCLELDALRDRKTVIALTIGMFQHLALRHSRDEQTAVDRSEFPANKPNNLMTLIEAASANAGLLAALSFLRSDDPIFADQVNRLRDGLDKACAPKVLLEAQ